MVFGIDDALGMGLGAAIGIGGQAMQNASSAAEAEKNRVFADQQAVYARSWSERMSNTAWQRGTADMKAAGINPMAAFQQGGASTPGASSASAPGNAPMGNVLGAGLSSAQQTATTIADLNSTHADAINKAAQASAATAAAGASVSTAKNQDLQSAILQRKMKAIGAEADADEVGAKWDQDHTTIRKILPIISQGASAAADAMSASTPVGAGIRAVSGLAGRLPGAMLNTKARLMPNTGVRVRKDTRIY